jgi:hypothetical protein
VCKWILRCIYASATLAITLMPPRFGAYMVGLMQEVLLGQEDLCDKQADRLERDIA